MATPTLEVPPETHGRLTGAVSFTTRQQPANFLRNHTYLARKPGTPVPPFTLQSLGEATIPNTYEPGPFVDNIVTIMTPLFEKDDDSQPPSPLAPPEFASVAGPRSKLFFDPTKVTAGVVTCGGLCPGLNNVIRALVYSLHFAYHVPKVLGFKYGFEGLIPPAEPIELTDELVKDIHTRAGSILGSSRGAQPSAEIVDTLIKYHVDMLFTIGGDGTMQGAFEIAREVERRGLKIGVIGIPKTIDNDICYVDASFGFQTAVSSAMPALNAVHEEARSAKGGVGVVKLMGRDAGFIALHACISNGDVNIVLIPEVPFNLETVLQHVERRVRRRGHCVLLCAEGAGQHLFAGIPDEYDRSGNRLQHDIGRFLSKKIDEHLKAAKVGSSVKFIDPSYSIRSATAIATDALLCVGLASNAVHAALAGLTATIVCHHHNTYVFVPIARAVHYIKRVNPSGPLYRTMLDATGMPADLTTPPTQ